MKPSYTIRRGMLLVDKKNENRILMVVAAKGSSVTLARLWPRNSAFSPPGKHITTVGAEPLCGRFHHIGQVAAHGAFVADAKLGMWVLAGGQRLDEALHAGAVLIEGDAPWAVDRLPPAGRGVENWVVLDYPGTVEALIDARA